MNKEDVRQKMLDIVGDIYNADSADYINNCFDNFDGHTWYEAKDTINKAFDNLTVVRQKVKLPRQVGEELDQFAARYVDVLQFAYHLYALSATEFPALVNWMCSAERRWVIIDAYRYGWEAEPEELFYVKVPENWGTGLTFTWVTMKYGGFDLINKEDSQTFTRAQIKEYHLDNDIFTLVPVVEEK